ncbi:MAG TPA: thioredoxin [Ktedonobacterales bacterium]
MAMVTLTDKNFDEYIAQPGVTLVDFWAEWCIPCHMVSPTIERIAEEYSGKITVGKLNVDESQRTAMRYHISGIPTIGIFQNGKLVNALVGVRPQQAYVAALDSLLAAAPAKEAGAKPQARD